MPPEQRRKTEARHGGRNSHREMRTATRHDTWIGSVTAKAFASCHQMFGKMSKYSSSSFLPPSPLPRDFSVATNSIRSIHFTIL